MNILGLSTATYSFRRHLGPRMMSAGLTIRIYPSDSFQVTTDDKEFEKNEYFRPSIDGFLMAIRDCSYSPKMRIHITKAEVHEVDSSPIAFERCAYVVLVSAKFLNLRADISSQSIPPAPLSPLEIETIKATAEENTPEMALQIPYLSVVSREFTGVGKFVNLSVSPGFPPIPIKDGLYGTKERYIYCPKVTHGITFVLSVTDGKFDMIEMVTNSGSWDGTEDGCFITK